MTYRITTTASWGGQKSELAHAFGLWGVKDWQVDANVLESRAHRSDLSRTDRAVTVRYVKGGRPIVLMLDTQARPVDNLRAIFLCVDAMRLIDVRGLGDAAQSAYLQLAGPAVSDPYQVLGIRPDAPLAVAEASFRELARTMHPDMEGGSHEKMADLNAAIARVRRDRGAA